MKVADVKLSWSKSVSPNVTKVQLVTVLDGNQTVVDLGPEVESFMVEMKANKSVQYSIKTYNGDGLVATSETGTFSTDDLVAPQPATNLHAEIVAVRDVADAPA